ncbi:LysR family transcriptional regulator [Roseobacter sp. HKCCD9010]|uniref:LysR family transcriptional regulator n=1 Tax=unclassified Roseobacter TaxID=196798 RepID=UPI001491C217|nr:MULTISPECIES: LysR family transcriptional regulator [unclassified Roseobacter]MBF9052555.1 LysR family transcriptional regulator [Rhodobacterales bacterium HKCCD4356]NNV14505.1 LysR family transcriptional regulator [Roseobacter sp. HKCCD7357]NNV18761.1 LysR family transcriptional regulator [Roseobacter sp. HKCCD8768]NNV28231.1 LysR family transcriptional regulator [Roseobacter sp. HKCCD8192]NNV32504.1 LysR family transcriptional regulator [Roseobacter sp. HKCCD9061]
MEMHQIRYFLAVFEYRNFTHAARAMNVSQPSLTTAIKKLEDRLGGKLFMRDRAGCSLTPLGLVVLPYLKEIMQQTQKAMLHAKRHIRLDGVPISVGVVEGIGLLRISNAIARYQCRAPEADFEIVVERQSIVLNGLREGRFDIAITSADAASELYQSVPLYSEVYRIVVSATHPLSQREAVNLGVLVGDETSARVDREMREGLFSFYAHCRDTMKLTHRSNRIDGLLELVRSGRGFLVLPDTAIPKSKEFASLAIADADFERHVVALRYLHQPARSEIRGFTRELARHMPVEEHCI